MQINLHMENCWGIVRAIVDLCLKLDEGKYLIVKEPNKPVMRLYSVPENAFEQVCIMASSPTACLGCRAIHEHHVHQQCCHTSHPCCSVNRCDAVGHLQHDAGVGLLMSTSLLTQTSTAVSCVYV